MMIVSIIYASSMPLSDYAGYYFGSIELLQKNYLNAYDMRILNFSIAQQGHQSVYVSFAPFPPFTSLIFAPFTLFPVYVSKVLFNVVSVLFFLSTIFRAIRFFSVPNYFVLLIPIVFFFPILGNLCNGQAYLILFCFLIEGYIAYKNGKKVLSAIFWSLAIMLKLFPVILFLFLFLRKKYNNALYLGLSCLLLFGLSLWINGYDVWCFYTKTILPKLSAGELNDSFTSAFQSAYMLCKKAFVYDQLLNLHPVYNNFLLFEVLMALFKGFLISLGIVFTVKRKDDDFMSFAIWIVISMLISPNGSNYSLILLLLPMIALNVRLQQPYPKNIQFLLILVLFLICTIPIKQFAHVSFLLGQFPRLYLLIIFFLLLAFQVKKPFSFKLFLGMSIFFIGFLFLKERPEQDGSSYFLNQEKDLFIYDFTVKNNHLVYFSWDGKTKETKTDFVVDTFNVQKIAIKNNQIYYQDKQLTHSPDWKKHPMIVNQNTIVYLSDKNRGVCFYTLRKMKLPY